MGLQAAFLVLAMAAGAEPPRVVIDPGHGGTQDGAVGPSGYKEKQFALELGKRVAKAVEKSAGAKVMLTRDQDVTLPLADRISAANRFKADLLISLHANSMPTRKLRAEHHGIETFFLSVAASGDGARKTADRENSEGGAAVAKAAASDDPLAFILSDMKRSDALSESSRLAYAIHQKLIGETKAEDRGVQQAPLHVLSVDCPAVLVELGFLSHPEESARLKAPEYQERLAAAIASAVKSYLTDVGTKAARP